MGTKSGSSSSGSAFTGPPAGPAPTAS
jgi:hypothetical protein